MLKENVGSMIFFSIRTVRIALRRGFSLSGSGVEDQGPVVQSIVSLTSSLRVILLTVLADSIYNILIFFAEMQKLLTFFQQKHFSIYAYHSI